MKFLIEEVNKSFENEEITKAAYDLIVWAKNNPKNYYILDRFPETHTYYHGKTILELTPYLLEKKVSNQMFFEMNYRAGGGIRRDRFSVESRIDQRFILSEYYDEKSEKHYAGPILLLIHDESFNGSNKFFHLPNGDVLPDGGDIIRLDEAVSKSQKAELKVRLMTSQCYYNGAIRPILREWT